MKHDSPFASDYVSPPSQPGWWARVFPSLVFYLKLGGIIFRASRIAKRGDYTDVSWIASSVETGRLVERMGATITIENTAAISDLTGPAVIVGNHMSTLETFLLASVINPHRQLTFVVKRQLVDTPLFGHVMRSRNPIVVGRAHPREDLRVMLEEGEARLRSGLSVVVFPQRTRATEWRPGEFNSIAVKLAKRAGAPVVPLAVRTDFWGIGRLIKDMGPIRPALPVRLSFGEPLVVQGNGRETQAAVVQFITVKMQSWGVPIVETTEGSAASI